MSAPSTGTTTSSRGPGPTSQQRQTRTNPSRASRTANRSLYPGQPLYGMGHNPPLTGNEPPYYGFQIAASTASAAAVPGGGGRAIAAGMGAAAAGSAADTAAAAAAGAANIAAAAATAAATAAGGSGSAGQRLAAEPIPLNGGMINGIPLPGPGQTPQAMYPAITHFTDAITALPKEFQRHASLLKEVDSKAWRLEEMLSQQLDGASKSTPFAAIVDDYLDQSVAGPEDNRTNPTHPSANPHSRRKLFADLHSTLTELMVTADEKNHVLWNANSELSKHMYRLETVYQYVQGEVSEDTRLGNKHHWAYWKKPEKPPRTSDRPRRETTHVSEAGKEAGSTSTRRRRTNKDRAEDDESTKGSRRGGAHSNAPAPKRRRVDKSEKSSTTVSTNAASVAMERTASNATVTQAGRTTSKEVDGNSTTATGASKPRRRAAAGTGSRRRNNTGGVSAHGSPIPTTASPARNYATASPIAASVRPVSSRAGGIAGNAASNAKPRPSPAASASRAGNNTGRGSLARDEQNTSYDSKYTDTNLKREDLQNLTIETSVDAPSYSRARSSKTSTPVTAEAQALATSSGRTTRHNNSNGRRGGGSSNATKKNSNNNTHAAPDDESEREQRDNKSAGNFTTPSSYQSMTTAFPGYNLTMEEYADSQYMTGRPQRSNAQNRNTANNNGHGDRDSQYLQTHQRHVQQTIDEDEIMEDESESEPRYCYCNGVSYGEMVACDKEDCEREWFHLSCVGLSKPPGKSAKWYCNECKDKMRKSKNGGK